MVGGRRCRKSTLLLILHAETAIRNPGVQTAYVAPVEVGLEKYISPIISTVFADCPYDLLPRYANGSLSFHNDSEVVFNGCNMRQYRHMRGRKLKLATVDEMAEVDDLTGAVDDVLFPATWDSHGEMVLSGTPPVVPSPDNPVMRYVSTAKVNDCYWHGSVFDGGYTTQEIAKAVKETSDGELDDEIAFYLVSLFEPGRSLTPHEITQLAKEKGIREEWLVRFRREFMAEFVRDESAVIVPEFQEKAHVKAIEKPVYYDMLYKGSGCDLGVADKTTEIFGYYDFPKATIVVEREFSIEGVEVRTDIFAAKHLSMVNELGWAGARATYWSDNSNLMLLQDLSALHKIYISATDKEDKAQWLNLLRILFKQGKISIDPSCKLLIATLNGAFWKDAQKRDYGRSKALGHMDALDAMIYFIRNLNMMGNPFPINYDLSQGHIFESANHIYPLDWNRQAKTEEGRVLAQVFGKRFNRKPFEPKKLGGL